MDKKGLVDKVYATIRTDSFEIDKIPALFEAIEQNPKYYVPMFMYTLEMNKIEAEHQGADNSAIFRKEFDKIGLIKKLHIRQPYGSVITPPKEFYTNEEVDAVFEHLETDELAQMRLDVMLMTNELEGRMMACFPDSELDKGPIFMREINKYGIPTSHRLTGKHDFDLLSKYIDDSEIVRLRHLEIL